MLPQMPRLWKSRTIVPNNDYYWSEEDEAFIAEVPELPGCAADGPTKQAALKNAEVIATAKELGRPIPEPKGRLVFA